MSWCVSSREEPGIALMDSHKYLFLSSQPVHEKSDSHLIPHSAWILLFWFLLFFVFKTGSHYVAQVGLELTVYPGWPLMCDLSVLPQSSKCCDYRQAPNTVNL